MSFPTPVGTLKSVSVFVAANLLKLSWSSMVAQMFRGNAVSKMRRTNSRTVSAESVMVDTVVEMKLLAKKIKNEDPPLGQPAARLARQI